ncbi:MAG: toll/interleukin-1 receptor domain-containing protein [Chloroflexi bacterium]|nr:MAG: toll/interleukin-1 receptor domain-containing protein [Chloroflexota bacterium]
METSSESFIAFFSYAHINDEHDRGRLTVLKKLLRDEIWVQTGKPFQIFQDTENIDWGQVWKERIKNALDRSSLFIAIITPSYLLSPQCRFEFEYFLKRESQLNRKLILPILYIDSSRLKDTNDEIATEISKRQWIDWRDLRFTSLTSAKMDKKLELLAKQIRDLISDEELVKVTANIESAFPPDSVVKETSAEDTSLPPTDFLPSLYIPLTQEEHLPQQITVILRSTGDEEHDRRRIKTLYGTLISFHGKDRFSFQIFERGKGYLIDYPNDTTRVCLELLERLKKFTGEDSWRLEEITFQ